MLYVTRFSSVQTLGLVDRIIPAFRVIIWKDYETKRRARVVSTPDLYSGGSGLKSLPGDRIS
jgi:hypothetical protein